MTAQEVSDYLGLSKETIYKLAQEGKIPHVHIGRRVLFKKERIDQWLEDKME